MPYVPEALANIRPVKLATFGPAGSGFVAGKIAAPRNFDFDSIEEWLRACDGVFVRAVGSSVCF